jgi:spore coat polysaccharide biosynthesis protein SpsF (cytidylyltransferase family)
MNSNRLPGKVLMSIAGKPILRHVVDSARESKLIDNVVVATSTMASDLPICEYCTANRIPLFTGSLDDVLDRYYQTAVIWQPTYIVRLTADCPMLTGDIIDRVVSVYLTTDFDYVRNAVDGYDVEVFHYEALLTAAKLADKPEEREHVTKFFQSGEFDWLDCYIPDNIVGKYSVDTQEEFDRIRGVMESG